MERLRRFFSTPLEDTRTAEQLARERFLLFHPATGNYRRWYCIAPAFVAQLCIGSFYSTSIFNKWADQRVWDVPGRNASGFTGLVAFYGIFTIILGNWIGRNGAFASVRIALLATPLGWGLASVALRTGQLWPLYLGYGGFHGLGCALCYISTTSMVQGWFPELKGFMSGLAVCGAGVGSFVWTTIGRALMDPKGPYALEPPAVQLAFSIVFFLLLGIVLPFMRNAPPNFAPPPLPLPNCREACARWAARLSHGGIALASAHTPAPVFTFREATRQQEFVLMAIIVGGTAITGGAAESCRC